MKRLKQQLRPYIERIRFWSLKQAVKKQNLKLYDNDISDQYTNLQVGKNSFLEYKLRALHSFQMNLIGTALDPLPISYSNPFNLRDVVIYDIGDSSGNHILLLKHFYKNIKTVSFNCDKNAVCKIKSKGLDAKHIGVDNSIGSWIKCNWLPRADVVVCFETMEHMTNLVSFMGSLKDITDTFVFTVPYVRKSRIGFYHMKGKNTGTCSEDLHIHELSPKDYDIIFRHYGWKREVGKVYWQYPKLSLFAPVLALLWYLIDYEGFYGAVYTKEK